MTVTLIHREAEVLKKYAALSADDPQGAWAPYYGDITEAAGGDAIVAYSVCKRLKRDRLLDCSGRQGANLASAPSYWPTEAGQKLAEGLADAAA